VSDTICRPTPAGTPQHGGDPVRGGAGDQLPVLHQEQQDEQAGDDPHDQHGGGAQPAEQPGQQRFDQRAQNPERLLGVRLGDPGERTGLVQPGRDLREDLAVAAEEPGDHDPEDQGDDPDRQHDDQWGAQPGVWNQSGRPGGRSTAGGWRPSTHAPHPCFALRFDASTDQSSPPSWHRGITHGG
jgi:hypothetical protein